MREVVEMEKKSYYYKKVPGDYRWLYSENDVLMRVYPRKDLIVSSKYNKEKDETTVKVERGAGEGR